MKRRIFVPAAALAALVLVAIPGCGPGKTSVTGTVKFRGKLLVTGTVIMVGPDRVRSSAPIGRDGTYRIESVTAGPVQIGVVSLKPSASTARPAKKRAGGGPPPHPVDDTGWFEIPEKYADPQASELSAELKSGANDHDIDLP